MENYRSGVQNLTKTFRDQTVMNVITIETVKHYDDLPSNSIGINLIMPVVYFRYILIYIFTLKKSKITYVLILFILIHSR